MKTVKLFVGILAAMALFNCQNESLDSSEPNGYNSTLSSGKQTASKLNGTSVYVSSNTSGILGVFDISSGLSSPTMKAIHVPYADADGVEYDANRDAVYQVNRTDKSLVALASISKSADGDWVTPSAMGPSTFANGRGSALYNNKVVIADDVTPGKLASYHVNDDNISDFRQYNVGFEVWDAHVNGKDLWAIEDVTSNLVYFQNFHNAMSGDLAYTAKVSIEGLVRTHGMDYDANTDIMVLTDIGSASGMPTSATDGALVIIKNFSSKFLAAGNGGTITLADQIRIAGDMTQLGNPVDVAVSPDKNAIFVAERAQQKLLIFEMPADNCNCTPIYATAFSGASSITTDF